MNAATTQTQPDARTRLLDTAMQVIRAQGYTASTVDDICRAAGLTSGPPSQSWKTFLRNHADAIAAIDPCVVRTLAFKLLFVFVVLGHGRRQLLWVEVTKHPTAEWLARQISEAFPWASASAYLVRDNDRAYGQVFTARVLTAVTGTNLRLERRRTKPGGSHAKAIGLHCGGGDSVGWLFSLKAGAQTSRGATNIPVQSQIFTPIQRAACGGSGPLLPCGIYQAMRSAPLLVRAVRRALLSWL
jgi:Bacterial regulatory proteins, tetR family